MQPIEIIVMISAISIVAGVLGNYIYKKITKKPTSECSLCHGDMKRAFKKIAKECEQERNYKTNCK